MKKNIYLSFTLSALLNLSGCATKPPDEPICIEMSLTRGECIRPMSGKKLTIDESHPYLGKTWFEMRASNISLPVTTWVEWKKFIIKVCKKNKNMCDKEVSSWDRSVESVDEQLKEKGALP